MGLLWGQDFKGLKLDIALVIFLLMNLQHLLVTSDVEKTSRFCIQGSFWSMLIFFPPFLKLFLF